MTLIEPRTSSNPAAAQADRGRRWPLPPAVTAAVVVLVLLVVAVQWPDNLLQRLLRKPRFLQPHPEWRQRLKRLRLRRRR